MILLQRSTLVGTAEDLPNKPPVDGGVDSVGGLLLPPRLENLERSFGSRSVCGSGYLFG